jgi:hypothetical protein
VGKTVKKSSAKATAKGTTSRAGQKPAEQDVDGHMFMPYDQNTASSLARIRSVEIDRSVRERQRANEAKKKTSGR